jgi:hypothetical protein
VKMLYSRCAGLDVHKKSVSACIRISRGQQTSQETRAFGTFTAGKSPGVAYRNGRARPYCH